MNIDKFNTTLSWLHELVVSRLDDEYDLSVEISSSSGGPGENVTAHICFIGVCYLSLPMVIRFSNSPKIRRCDYQKSIELLPLSNLDDGYEEEIKENKLIVHQFLDGDVETGFFVASYDIELSQEPVDWSYG